MRIVSLVPSITKTLCDLGLKKQIVGITNFCVDPPDLYRTAVRVGGTKDPDIGAISKLSPTHVILNREENRDVDISALGAEFSTIVTFPKKPTDVPDMISQLGKYLGVQDVARNLERDIRSKIERISDVDAWCKLLGKRFLYMIWRDPWMTVGQDTYISNFLELLGLENAWRGSERYPTIDLSVVSRFDVDVILLSSEPWAFRKRDAEHIRDVIGTSCPKIYWIDGKAFSWYGSITSEVLNAISDDPMQSGLIKQL